LPPLPFLSIYFKPKLDELIPEPLIVLLHPELHDLRPVPHVAQVGVHPAHHLLASMAEFSAHRIEAHRCPAVERLEPSMGSTDRQRWARVPPGLAWSDQDCLAIGSGC
jgi:hypothetical protein